MTIGENFGPRANIVASYEGSGAPDFSADFGAWYFDNTNSTLYFYSPTGWQPISNPVVIDGCGSLNSISADGRIAGGTSPDNFPQLVILPYPFQIIPCLGSVDGGSVIACNGDGSVNVGIYVTSPGAPIMPCIWNASGVLTALPTAIGDDYGQALAVSADGTIVAGQCSVMSVGRPVKWVAGVLNDLEVDPVGLNGLALGISADGTTIVGNFTDATSAQHACYWTGTTLHALPDLSSTQSSAVAVSQDGRIIIGSVNALASGMGKWVELADPVELAIPAGMVSIQANCIDYSGNVIAGWSEDADSVFHPTVWEGPLSIPRVLPAPPWATDYLGQVLGISGDGTIGVGDTETILGAYIGAVWSI